MFACKSTVLLLGGLAMGWFAGPGGIGPLDRLFFALIKGVHAFFQLANVQVLRTEKFRPFHPFQPPEESPCAS